MSSQPTPVLPLLLIVEDSEDDYDAMRAAFGEAQVANPYFRCRGGREALEYLKCEGIFKGGGAAERPGLVLLDLNMPGIDGRKVLEKLKADPDLKSIPVIVLTTSNNEQDVLSCYQAGAAAYMRKPSDFKGLVDSIRRLKDYWFEKVIFPKGGVQKPLDAIDMLFNRGWRHQVGFDVAQDNLQAYVWYGRAALAGHRDAGKRCEDLAAHMNTEQLAEAKKLVGEWQAAKKQP